MKTVKDVAIYVAEDGERFLSEVEAVTHDSLLYIGKTIEAFGGGQVAEAIKAVELRHPQICSALFHLAKHLQGVQSLLPAGDSTPKIDSVNAPPTVAANPAPGSIEGDSVKEPNGIPAEALQSSSIPEVPPAGPDDVPETPVNPPSPDLERVTKPDETPREPPHPEDVPSQIYPGGGKTIGQLIDEQNKGLAPDPTDEGVPGSKLQIPSAAA